MIVTETKEIDLGKRVVLEKLVRVAKALADEKRLEVLALIAQQGDVCVCEVSDTLDISQPLASKYLKQLRDAGIVQVSKQGRWSIYSLGDTTLIEPFLERLRNYPLPPIRRCARC